MFWADQIVEEFERVHGLAPEKAKDRKIILRDEKTASGRVHVGSLRGVIVHAIVTQALREKGYDAEFWFEINDADPMDGLPVYLDQKTFKPFMGKPLKDVPSPEPGHKNYARYFGDEFIEVIHKLSFRPNFYYASDMYAEGKYDHWIDLALEHPEEIRKIYKEISGSEKKDEWNPVQIVCENCGKVGTTTVTGSTGEAGKKIVTYRCELKKVKWAVGCGYEGKVSPYKGRGKLPWKAEWAAKFQIFPVDIEGAGKDHSAAGGAREISETIAKHIFKGTVPFDIPYEYFLFGGAKMSSSKGIGASAKEVSDIIPPQLLRFLMVRTRPNQTIDFSPEGDTIPRLYDRYDESAEVYFGRQTVEANEDVKRAYYFSRLEPKNIPDTYRPRFSWVAFLIQLPHFDFLKEVEKMKGSKLNDEDRKEAEERKYYAELWLKKYASENAKFEVQEKIPEKAKILSADQRKFLNDLADLLGSTSWRTGEELHAQVHELRKKSPLEARDAFSAVYLALLGKDSGPQVGWFLEALDRAFVIRRFVELAKI